MAQYHEETKLRDRGPIILAAAMLGLLGGCSRPSTIASTNATVNAALSDLDNIATARPAVTSDKAARGNREPLRVADRP
jgi:hypothetical protein